MSVHVPDLPMVYQLVASRATRHTKSPAPLALVIESPALRAVPLSTITSELSGFITIAAAVVEYTQKLMPAAAPGRFHVPAPVAKKAVPYIPAEVISAEDIPLLSELILMAPWIVPVVARLRAEKSSLVTPVEEEKTTVFAVSSKFRVRSSSDPSPRPKNVIAPSPSPVSLTPAAPRVRSEPVMVRSPVMVVLGVIVTPLAPLALCSQKI